MVAHTTMLEISCTGSNYTWSKFTFFCFPVSETHALIRQSKCIGRSASLMVKYKKIRVFFQNKTHIEQFHIKF